MRSAQEEAHADEMARQRALEAAAAPASQPPPPPGGGPPLPSGPPPGAGGGGGGAPPLPPRPPPGMQMPPMAPGVPPGQQWHEGQPLPPMPPPGMQQGPPQQKKFSADRPKFSGRAGDHFSFRVKVCELSDEEIAEMVAARERARAERKWDEADVLRQDLRQARLACASTPGLDEPCPPARLTSSAPPPAQPYAAHLRPASLRPAPLLDQAGVELFDKEEPPVWKSADGRTGFIMLHKVEVAAVTVAGGGSEVPAAAREIVHGACARAERRAR